MTSRFLRNAVHCLQVRTVDYKHVKELLRSFITDQPPELNLVVVSNRGMLLCRRPSHVCSLLCLCGIAGVTAKALQEG